MKKNAMTATASTSMETKIGEIRIEATDLGISRVTLVGSRQPAVEQADAAVAAEPAPKHLRAAANALSEYLLTGAPIPSLPLDIEGTEFQKSVWAEIARLSSGESITYAEIAERIGNPRAVRAVGGAVGANPVPLLIGCHRVLGAGGRITGYSGGDGLATKRVLLDLEQISFCE